jgi:hypothetical protein
MQLSVIIHRLPVGWIGRFILLRLWARWRSMLTAILGVVLVTMIGASVPLYTAAIAQIGMIQRIEQQAPEDVHIFARISQRASDSPDLDTEWADRSKTMHDAAADLLSLPGWMQQTFTLGETTPMQLVIDGEDRERGCGRPITKAGRNRPICSRAHGRVTHRMCLRPRSKP